MVDSPKRKKAFFGRAEKTHKSDKHAATLAGNPMTPIPDNPQSRKIGEIEETPGGHKVVYTAEKGTRLDLEEDFETYKFFTNRGVIDKSIAKKLDFDAEDAVETEEVTRTVTITAARLREVRAEITATKGRRSQIKVKGHSAAQEAEDHGVKEPGQRWEWLHLIAYCLLGEEAQDFDNIFAGSRYTNTVMWLVAEKHIEHLVAEGKDVTLNVAATLQKDTQILQGIKYNIDGHLEGATFKFDSADGLEKDMAGRLPLTALGGYAARALSYPAERWTTRTTSPEPAPQSGMQLRSGRQLGL